MVTRGSMLTCDIQSIEKRHKVQCFFTFLKKWRLSFWRQAFDSRDCSSWIDWGRLSGSCCHQERLAPRPAGTGRGWWSFFSFLAELGGSCRVAWLGTLFFVVFGGESHGAQFGLIGLFLVGRLYCGENHGAQFGLIGLFLVGRLWGSLFSSAVFLFQTGHHVRPGLLTGQRGILQQGRRASGRLKHHTSCHGMKKKR